MAEPGRCGFCGQASTPAGPIFHIGGCPSESPAVTTALLGGSRPTYRRPPAPARAHGAGWLQESLPIALPILPAAPRKAANVQAIAERYLAGESIKSIAESEEVHYNTVRNRLGEAGVLAPRPRESQVREPRIRPHPAAGPTCAECGQPRDAQGVIEHAGTCRYANHAELGRLYGALRAS